MSRTGALIEASILPETGTPVRLVRGSLEAAGQTVWSIGERCGIAFSSEVCVEAWLPDSNSRQARVDTLVDSIRDDIKSPEWPEAAASKGAGAGKEFEVLAKLARTLERQFAGDPATIASFSCELQGFDLLAQALEASYSKDPDSRRRLADIMSACNELLRRLETAPKDEAGLLQTGPDSSCPEIVG
jgi:hypothetical protein